MRLIDADALPRHGQRKGLVYARDIDSAPTIDAESVVRCKDCVYRPCKQMPYSYDHDYCSYGERGRRMRLIDADALLDAISVHLERIEQEIDDAPTIDPPALIEEPVYLDTEEVTRMVIEKLAQQKG